MSALTVLAILVGLLILGWAIWFVIEFLRYTLSGEYEMDKRLREIIR
jgi:hypothetical protein